MLNGYILFSVKGKTATRWGILSAGKISSDFCFALRTMPENEHKVVFN